MLRSLDTFTAHYLRYRKKSKVLEEMKQQEPLTKTKRSQDF